MTPNRAAARWIRFATPVGLFALAWIVRAGPWRDVFAGGVAVPAGNDAFYHLRRIVHALAGGGVLEFDRYLNHPTGARPIWPPLFDRLCAAVLAPFASDPAGAGQPRIEALAMWIPPLLGGLAVVATWATTRRHWGDAAGLLAGGLLALLSGHFWYSQVGFLDHHAAVALAAVGVLGAGLSLVAAHEGGAASWARAVWLGALAALALALWPGSLLHVGLVFAGLLGVLLACPVAEAARRLAFALACACGVAALLLAPAGWNASWPQWGAWSPVVLSRFQPLLFAAAALVLAGCGVLGSDRGRRAAVLVAGSAVVGAGLLLAVPGLREGLDDAWRWLAKAESFQSGVAESQPLLSDGGVFTLAIATARLSWLGLALPLLAAFVLWRKRRDPAFARTAVAAAFALGLLGVTLLQKRFFNSASIGVAMMGAVAIVELWRALPRRPQRVALVGVALLGTWPALAPYGRFLANEARALRGEKHAVTGGFMQQRRAVETALWLRDHTPATSGWLDPAQAPEYAVLAPWPLGHALQYVARRPTLVDNFGDDLGGDGFAFVDGYYRAPESAERVEAARARGVRYVVAQPGAAHLTAPARPGSLAHALVHWGDPGEGAPLVRHHRLVFASGGIGGRPDDPPLYRVYELVPGALVEGRAAPGARVELRIGVGERPGTRSFHRDATVADAEGRYRFRVPHPTGPTGAGGALGGVQAAPLYRLACAGEVRGVAVPEAAVRSGATVVGPRLCATL